MEKTRHRVNRINESAAILAKMIQGEKVYAQDEVPEGFVSVDDIMAKDKTISLQTARRMCMRLYRSGKAERIVVMCRSRRNYYYRPK